MPATLDRLAKPARWSESSLTPKVEDSTGAFGAQFFVEGFASAIPGVPIDWFSSVLPSDNRGNIANGATTGTWYDAGRINRDFTQGTGTKQPTFRSSAATVNNQPALDFDGGDALGTASYPNLTGGVTLACVVYVDPTQSTAGFVFSGYDVMVKVRTDGSLEMYCWGSSTATQLGSADRRGQLCLVVAYFNGASSKWQVNALTGTAPLMAGGNAFASRLTLGSWDGNANAGDTVISKFGFAGLYAGDLFSHPSYQDFQTWVGNTYAIPHLTGATFTGNLGGLAGAVTATPSGSGGTVSATFAGSLGGLTGAVAATPDHPVTFNKVLPAITGFITATPNHLATMAGSLGGLTGAITAGREVPATLASSLGGLSGALWPFEGVLPVDPVPPGVSYTGTLTITTGGTYSGNYTHVDVNTTSPVVLDGMNIKGAGPLIGLGARVDLEVRNCYFEGTGAVGTTSERTIDGNGTGNGVLRLIFENNEGKNIAGIKVRDVSGLTTRTISIRYNRWRNVNQDHTADFAQFVQLSGSSSGGNSMVGGSVEIAWNEIYNVYGQSSVEDNINLFNAGGASSGSRWLIHDNLIWGAWYEDSYTNSGYSGGGIMLHDANPVTVGHTETYNNYILGTSANYGISCVGGTDAYVHDNVIVSSGTNVNQTPFAPTAGGGPVGLAMWDNNGVGAPTNHTYANNSIAYWKPLNGGGSRNDYWLPLVGSNGNTATGTTSWKAGQVFWIDEAAAYQTWLAGVVSGGITLGRTSGVSAVFAGALGGLTGALASTVSHPAVFAAVLGPVTGGVAATPNHPATFAATFGSLTGTIVASPSRVATFSGALGGLTGSITALPTVLAVFGGSLGALTGALVATQFAPLTGSPPPYASTLTVGISTSGLAVSQNSSTLGVS